LVEPDATFTGLERFIEKYNITEGNRAGDLLYLNLTDEAAQKLRENKRIRKIEKIIDTTKIFDQRIFPHNPQYSWNIDNYGPIYIPEKGNTVKINNQTLPFYKRIIEEYEHNRLRVEGDNIYINDVLTDSYTFKQNYYWMMGDNRHNSEDARFWGFVPFDHVVGKPTFIWFSLEHNNPQNPKSFVKRIRWERMFTTVGGSGKPVSYLPHFLIGLAAIFGYSYFKNKKKTSK
jgi:signal peptidase I